MYLTVVFLQFIKTFDIDEGRETVALGCGRSIFRHIIVYFFSKDINDGTILASQIISV